MTLLDRTHPHPFALVFIEPTLIFPGLPPNGISGLIVEKRNGGYWVPKLAILRTGQASKEAAGVWDRQRVEVALVRMQTGMETAKLDGPLYGRNGMTEC